VDDLQERIREWWSRQRFMDYLGVRLVECAEGYGKVAIRVGPHHLNAQGSAHGGVILALADGAFAVSTATVAPRGVGAQVNLHHIAPAQEGDELVAESRVIHPGRRSIVVEVNVSNGNGKLVARGTGLGMRIE